jgi:hypothetical protein
MLYYYLLSVNSALVTSVYSERERGREEIKMSQREREGEKISDLPPLSPSTEFFSLALTIFIFIHLHWLNFNISSFLR